MVGMLTRNIIMTPFDFTVFAKCPNCAGYRPGTNIMNLFLKAYTRRGWAKGPTCDNCHRPMVKLYEVEVD